MFKKIFGINTEKESSNNINVDDLYGEIDVLKEEIENLLDIKEKKDKDIKELSFKLTVLNATLRDKDDEIKSLLEKVNSLTERLDKPNNVTEKLFQTIKDRDLTIDSLKLENENLRKSLVMDFKETPLEEILNPDLVNYKMLIRDYYEARKFEEFKKICQDRDLFYVDELYSLDFESIPLTKTKIKNAKSHYEDYVNKKFDSKIIAYLLKGALISEYFFRFRSFVNFCKDNDLTYLIELDNFDFDSLDENKFSSEQIQKIKDAYNEFNTVHRIRR